MLTQNIQVLGERNQKDKLNNIDLTRSVRLNDLTQEEMAKLYRRGQTNVSTGSLNQGFKFDYLFDGNTYIVSLDVVAITFDSATQAVVFDCGYSTVYNRYYRVLLINTDGVYSWNERITAPTWVDESDLKTINGESLIGTGDIEIAAGVESLNGQKGALTLKTVNGNELIGTGNIEIKGGGDATPTGTTLYFTTTDGQTLNANIEAKNKAGAVIEPSLKTPTAWYYDEIVETMRFPSKTTNCNLYSLNGVNIPLKLTDEHMSYIMENCRYADLRKFFTNGLTGLSNMFAGSKSLEWVDVSNFNTSKVAFMGYMFKDCTNLVSLDISKWDTSKVIYMTQMFYGCYSLASLDVSKWNTSQVTEMSNMFGSCKALTSLDVSKWNTSQVTKMYNMFSSCKALTSLDLSNWDTSNVTDMSYMFNNCNSLASLNISHWNISNVTDMDTMFSSCKALTSLDLSNWNTSKLKNIDWMFNYCIALTSLDLSKWDLTNVTSMNNMFNRCDALKTIIMKNCSTETVDKIKAALTEVGILSNVQIITA